MTRVKIRMEETVAVHQMSRILHFLFITCHVLVNSINIDNTGVYYYYKFINTAEFLKISCFFVSKYYFHEIQFSPSMLSYSVKKNQDLNSVVMLAKFVLKMIVFNTLWANIKNIIIQ